MTDIASIRGKALVDRQVMIQLLALLEPAELDHTATIYHVGYERAKADIVKVLGRSLGTEYATSVSSRIIKELRRDKSS